MSSIARSVLNDLSKNIPIWSFSKWPLVVIVLSVFRINQINSCNQSIPSSCFLFSRQVKNRCPKFFLIPLLSAYTVILPANFTSILLTSQYFHVVGGIFLFFYFVIWWNYCDQWSSIYDELFFCSVFFYCHVNMVFAVGASSHLVNILLDLSVSLSSVLSSSVTQLNSCLFRCSDLQTSVKWLYFCSSNIFIPGLGNND